jgi:hypothetical protein
MRVIGLDVHRSMAVVAILENGHLKRFYAGGVDGGRRKLSLLFTQVHGDDRCKIPITLFI